MLDYGTQKLGKIGQFRFWCQKVLPAVYDDSLSYYELLAKVIEKLNEVIEKYNGTDSVWEYILEQLESMQKEIDDFIDGGFEEALDEWARQNMATIIGELAKMVTFGLTLNGYFVAYIPESWSDIWFDTGFDYSLDTYGRLILRFQVESEMPVDQTPEIVRP